MNRLRSPKSLQILWLHNNNSTMVPAISASMFLMQESTSPFSSALAGKIVLMGMGVQDALPFRQGIQGQLRHIVAVGFSRRDGGGGVDESATQPPQSS